MIEIRDSFGPDDLDELLSHTGMPALSIYLPGARSGDSREVRRSDFRAAVHDVATRLRERSDVDAMMDDLTRLADDREFWGRGFDGLAVFASVDATLVFRSHVRFERRVEVADTFHTRPLVRALNAPDRYWLLFVSQKDVRLWEGSADGLRPVETALIPRDMRAALGYDFERDEPVQITRKQTGGEHGEHGRGGVMPVFHGHGVGADDSENELRDFFRRVDEGVRQFLRGRGGPLVLASVAEHQPLYREVTGLGQLTAEGIQGSVRDWSAERLQAAAWPIVERHAARAVEDAIALWESTGRGKIEADPAAIARLAAAGRVRLLLIEEGREIPGSVDRRSGETRLSMTRDVSDEADVLDDISEITLLHRGTVLVVPADAMPTDTGAAAVLR